MYEKCALLLLSYIFSEMAQNKWKLELKRKRFKFEKIYMYKNYRHKIFASMRKGTKICVILIHINAIKRTDL
jgi:hypothetical protein